MLFLNNRFFYEGEAGTEGGGANADAVIADAEPKLEVVADAPKIEAPVITLEQMKQWGFDSPEQLQKHFDEVKKNNITEEEKIKQAQLDDAEFRKYAIANDLMKAEDFKTYETLAQKQAADLVFEKHLKEFKEDNPEITDEKELADLAKADFNSTYKLDSDSEKVKARGLAKIEKEAKELKAPVESTFTTAKEKYETFKDINTKYPAFQQKLEEKVKQHTPDKAVVFKAKDGESEINIEIELTDADRKAIAKDFSNPKTFHEFNTLPKEDFDAKMDKKIQSWVNSNKVEDIKTKTLEAGINIGKAKGSNVGAGNPFPLINKTNTGTGTNIKSLDEQIAESHNNASKNYIR